MRFEKTTLDGAYLIDLEKREDERGFFSRLFCSDEFHKRGLKSNLIQANDSFSKEKGTLRGLHYQLAPFAETKLVRCISGEIYDVIVDLRANSPTYKMSFGTHLNEDNRTMMYVPEGFAHGFLTLTDNSEVLYLVSKPYSKEYERGIRYDDPNFSIPWPIKPHVISERDLSHPNFTEGSP